MALHDLIDECIVLGSLGLVNKVVIVNTDHRLVSRDFNNVEGVDLLEFLALCHCGTGHTGKLLVKTEIVLEGDGCKSFALVLNLNAFFSLDSLVKTFVISSAEHDTAGEFVNDKNLIVLNNVVYVTAHNAYSLDSLIDMVEESHVLCVHEVVNIEIGLSLSNTALGKRCRSCLFVNNVVAVGNILGILLGVDLLNNSLCKGVNEVVCKGVKLC